MIKKFTDLKETDNIETIASVLKTEMENYRKEYEEMKKDGVIDEDEFKRIIATMKELTSKSNELKSKMTNEKEISIMNDIVSIILDEQEKMININDQAKNVEETKESSETLTQN